MSRIALWFFAGYGCGTLLWYILGLVGFLSPTETIRDSNGVPEGFSGEVMFQQRVDIDARGCDAFLIDPSQTELNIDLRGCIVFSYRPTVNSKY